MKLILFFCSLIIGTLHACTAFQLQSQDSAFIYCRSMEYAFPMDSNILIVPRGISFTGTAPGKKQGLQWQVKYGYVGTNQVMDRTTVSDGMNEKGLVVGCLYLPGFAQYEKPEKNQFKQVIGPWEMTSFLLGTCSTLEDVRAILPQVIIAEQPTPGMGNFILPLHFYVCDTQGNALVIEYVGGKRNIYDNPIGVLTNSPPFDWQLLNLANYIKLSPLNAIDVDLQKLHIHNFGQGSGFLGLPGDYTPPSRFVKAAFFSQSALPKKTAPETVVLGFHILNTFDIFEGAIRPAGAEKAPLETTQWTIIHDRTNLKTYFRSYGSLQIQMVDLTAIDFSQKNCLQIPLKKEFVVEDVTTSTIPL